MNMADPDCGFCALSGYRACDICGNPIMDGRGLDALGRELCVYCS